MSTELIIAIIIVVVLVLIARLVMLPRMRAAANRNQAQRELQSRREYGRGAAPPAKAAECVETPAGNGRAQGTHPGAGGRT